MLEKNCSALSNLRVVPEGQFEKKAVLKSSFTLQTGNRTQKLIRKDASFDEEAGKRSNIISIGYKLEESSGFHNLIPLSL